MSAVIDHRPQQRQLQPPPQPRQRRDPAPSRLQYRLERVWLKPLYRRVIRVGVPAFLIAMTALFNWAGFLVAGPPTVAGFMLMMEEKRPWHVAVTAFGATAAIWLFFWQFLKLPLP